MATRPKAVIESRDGEKFSPITIAKNVLTDDGQNLHDILSDRKEDMMTPTIESSSSMFKVGQGDNVDYSGNVVNGAYDSMVLKGKTMVNCIQEPSSQDVVLPYEFADGQYMTINDTKESGALGIELKGQTLVNLLGELAAELNNNPWSEDENNYNLDLATGNGQPTLSFRTLYTLPANKTYTLFINMTSHVTGVIHIDFRTPSNTSSSSNQRYFGEAGWQKLVFTTTEETGFVRMFNRNGVDNTYSIGKSLMLLEGDHTNIPIPNYFTGIASCKMPTLHTVGKNLFDGKLEKGSLDVNTGKPSVDNSFNRTINFIRIYPNKEYRLRANGTTNGRVFYYDENKVYISTQLNENRLTNIPSNAKYLKFRIGTDILSNGQEIQLEEGSVATAYEQHKSSILSLPEEVVLHSLPNGVCDTFNTRTGEYVQRIGERVINGTENWYLQEEYEDGALRFKLNVVEHKHLGASVINVRCDKMPVYSTHDSTYEKLSFCSQGQNCFQIIVPSNIALENGISNSTTFKSWLAQNYAPMTVCYQLTEPIVTKINLSSTLKSWNTTTHIYSEIPENTLYPILSHSNPTYPVILKPSTKYSIVANSYSNNHTNSTINFNLGGATASTTVGNRVTTITTPSTLSNELLTMSGRGNKLNNVMVIEGGVVGDEPYFEGICDCKSPILSNVGKNLLPTELSRSFKHITGNQVVSSIDLTSFLNREVQYVIKLAIPKNVKIAKHYSSNSADTESVLVSHGAINSNNTIARFTIPSNSSSYYLFVNESGQSPSDYISDISELVTIELDTGNVPTEITPYKSNITTFDQKDDKTIVLRSLPNGVCDTLNVETGEYVQRIGEIVLDGNEDWIVNGYTNNQSNVLSYFSFRPSNLNCIYNQRDRGLSPKFHNIDCASSPNNEGWQIYNGQVRVNVLKSKLSEDSVVGFKRWLSQNPIAIQHELATSIVSTVDIQGFPHAYTNGHVQLSSGSIEQSLTPKVEYSVVTNRNGQIRSNQKMVERHQKQLDRLQSMILTNLVNTQYEQTLTNLKYDLKNVREEVK